MRRREFLQRTAGGLLLSVLPARTAAGAAAEDVTLSSDGFALTVRVPDDGPAQVRSVRNPKTGFEWCQPDTPFEPVLVSAGGQHTGWTARRGAGTAHQFEFVARHAASAVSARSVLRTVAGAPMVEVRTEFQHTGAQPLTGLTAFGAVRFRLRDDLGEVKVHQGVFADLVVVEAVGTGEFLLLGGHFAGGVVCRIEEGSSGRWLNLEISGTKGIAVASTLQSGVWTHDVLPEERLPVQRVFLGVAHGGDPDDAFRTIQHYLQRHVIPSPPKNWPWPFYLFWSTRPQAQEDFLRNIDLAAELGVELLIHDATWYEGGSTSGYPDDWGIGLGHWRENRKKYPMGLAALSRRIHEKGMKFGLWIDPGVVDSRLVGSLVKEQWVCEMDGERLLDRNPAFSAAPASHGVTLTGMCLGCPEYVEYLKRALTGVVERYQVDYLRWDDSSTQRCNRTDHGHQAGDWAYVAWYRGYREIVAHLHAKFPNLILAEMLGAVTAPVFVVPGVPPANQGAAFCWLLWDGGPDERSALGRDPTDTELDAAFRLRMRGMFGFVVSSGMEPEFVTSYPVSVLTAARRNIALYKRFRHLLNHDGYQLLPAPGSASPAEITRWQAGVAKGQWLVTQFVDAAGDEAAVLAFRNGSPQETVRVPLRALREGRVYEVTSSNTGSRLIVRGLELLRDGVAVVLPNPVMSDVILIRALSD